MTKITIENQYVTVNINTEKDDMTINEMIEELIKPSMYSLGYSPELVDDYFVNDME